MKPTNGNTETKSTCFYNRKARTIEWTIIIILNFYTFKTKILIVLTFIKKILNFFTLKKNPEFLPQH